MLNEFKRPMWNDGPAKQPWLNYFNEYERTHCCFGDDDNPDESENGVERGELGDFNVDPGYNPDTSMNQVDGGFVSDAGTSFTTDPTTGELNVDASGRVGPDGTVGIEGELGYNDLADIGYFDALDKSIQAQDLKQADELNKELAAKDLDAQVTVDKQGNYSYTGPDMFSALGGEISKVATEFSPTIQALQAIFGDNKQKQTRSTPTSSAPTSSNKGISSLVNPETVTKTSLSEPAWAANARATANQYATDVLGLVDRDAQTYRDSLVDMDSLRANSALASMQENADREQARLSNVVEKIMEMQESGYRNKSKAEKLQAGLEDLISGRQMTAAEEAALVNAARSKRAAGGMVYRNEGGEVEEKTKSAMELYLEKLGQPSKYTVPMVPMNTPSMAPPPDTSDPFALAEYRKNLARETMGSYLPYDPAGASSAINTFNENYYGGASNVNPYNVAQLASLYGLPRDAATYEGIIGMLGGVRSEAPPPPPVVPDPEPEPDIPIIPDDPDDDNYSMYDEEEEDFGGIGSIDDEETTVDTGDNYDGSDDYAQGGRISDVLYRQTGGGIRDVLYRQTGGDIKPSWMQNDMLEAQDDYKRIYESDLTKPGTEYRTPTLGSPTWKRPDYLERRMPPLPPKPEPPPPPPEPEIIYDPVREEAARKRARELQALKIGKLDTAPQTTAERLALEKSGGFYRDDAGNVRDASGAFQEDFAYDYTAPPPIDSGLSGDDFNFTGDPDPVPEPPPPTDPIPLPDPTDPIPLPDDPIRPGPVYPLPYPFPDKPITYPDRPGVVYPYDPSQPFQPSGPDGGPMM